MLEALAGPLDVMQFPMSNRRRLVLRRTLDYLEANPYSPVTVHELAQIVGCGIRTLEYVFRDYFGTTPKAYLTTRRLIGARRELQRSDAESTRVGDIALRWGFWHLGRFSTGYRQFFGELPSQTLEKN
jgi:AraC family ethanolamine operon transcriptional activator